VDEIVCRMQSPFEKAAIVGLRLLQMRVGVAECRSGSRETYRVSRGNEKVCLRAGVASRPSCEGIVTSYCPHARVNGSHHRWR
jgi:hypothetical protein